MKSQKARNRTFEREKFWRVNKERKKRGLRELKSKIYLIRAARRHSRYMIKKHRFAHTTRKWRKGKNKKTLLGCQK